MSKVWSPPDSKQLGKIAKAKRARVGLISDTHDLLRAPVAQALSGCDWILHAGDVCRAEVLDGLAEIAPVSVVRGNNAFGEMEALPHSIEIVLAGVRIYMVHDRKDIDFVPGSADIVLFGHSHQPESYASEGVFYVNPGAAGPRRFTLPIAWAELHIRNGRWTVVPKSIDA